MSSPDPQIDSLQSRGSSSVSLELLQRQLEVLRTLFTTALLALILLSLGVTLFVAKQMRMVRAQLDDQRPNVTKLATDYRNVSEPLIRNFTSRLQGFAATNPDFKPILDRYRPALGAYLNSPATPGPVAPSPGPVLPRK